MIYLLKILLLSLRLEIVYGEQYVVYPKNTRDTQTCTITSEYLHHLLGESYVRSVTSEVRGTTEFWLVEATKGQSLTIATLPGVSISPTSHPIAARAHALLQVSSVLENVEVAENTVEGIPATSTANSSRNVTRFASLTRNDGISGLPPNVLRQADAPQDLNVLSWPPWKSLPRRFPGYVYDVTKGVRTWIYVIDNGLNPQNSVRSVLELRE